MNKMGNILWIVGGLALALVAYYSYQRRKTRKTKSKEELIEEFVSGLKEAEKVDKLAMADVVNYFKSFRLRKGRDIPFIAKTKKDGTYLLGTFNEETNTFENWKVVAPNSIDDELLKVLGNETLVVLS